MSRTYGLTDGGGQIDIDVANSPRDTLFSKTGHELVHSLTVHRLHGLLRRNNSKLEEAACFFTEQVIFSEYYSFEIIDESDRQSAYDNASAYGGLPRGDASNVIADLDAEAPQFFDQR